MHAVVDIERRITAIEATPPRAGHRGPGRFAGWHLPAQRHRRRAPGRARSGHAAAPDARRHRRHQPHRRLRVDPSHGSRGVRRPAVSRRRRGSGSARARSSARGCVPGGSAQAAFAGEAESVHAIRTAGPLVTDDDELALARVPRAAGGEHAPSPSRRHHPGRRRRTRSTRSSATATGNPTAPRWRCTSTTSRRPSTRRDAHVASRVKATPRVLPFPECQWAPEHAALLVGRPVQTLPHRRADDAHRAPGVHAPQRHAALPHRGPRARRGDRRDRLTRVRPAPTRPATFGSRGSTSGQVGHAAADGVGGERRVGARPSPACRRARGARA